MILFALQNLFLIKTIVFTDGFQQKGTLFLAWAGVALLGHRFRQDPAVRGCEDVRGNNTQDFSAVFSPTGVKGAL